MFTKYGYIFIFFLSLSLSLFSFTLAGKPQIIDKTDNSVTITWTRSTKFGQSSLLGYTVEMYGRNDTDGWVPVASRLQDTTYTQEGLTAGVSYYFVVRAENGHGMSSPSTISEPVVVGIVSLNIELFSFFSLKLLGIVDNQIQSFF